MGDIALRDWKAWEHSYASADDLCILIVTGLAQVLNGTKMMLQEQEQSNGEPAILDLKFVGQTGTSWEPVWFLKRIQPGTYTDVRLIGPHGSREELIKVS